MLNTHLMIRTYDRTLKQAPDTFNPVRVNISNNPFFGRVINPPMLSVGIFNSPIGGHFVGVNRLRVRRGIVMNELMQDCFGSVGNHLQSNLSFTLDCTDSDGFVPLVSATVTANLSADVRFVNFNDTPKQIAVNLAHSSTNTVAEIPS